MNEAERKECVKTFISSYYRDNQNDILEETVIMVEEILEKLPTYEFGIFLNPEYFDESQIPFIKDVSKYTKDLIRESDEKTKKKLIYALIDEYACFKSTKEEYGWEFHFLNHVLDTAPSITEFWRWCEHRLRGVPCPNIPWEKSLKKVPCRQDSDIVCDHHKVGAMMAESFNKCSPGFIDRLCEYCKVFIY